MIRESASVNIKRTKIVVGDIINILPGMEIPADCLIISSSQLMAEESSITENNNIIKKSSLPECIIKKKKFEKNTSPNQDESCLPSPILLSGSKILTGEGKAFVLEVGNQTYIRNMKKSPKKSISNKTPLEMELQVLASQIGKIALQSTLLILFVLLMRFIIERTSAVSWDNDKHWDQLFNCFLIAVLKLYTIFILS